MEAKVRLDNHGTPFLSVSYQETESQDASGDAEALFFRNLREKGGTIHIIPGREGVTKFILVAGNGNYQASSSQTRILGNPIPRNAPISNPVADATESYLNETPTKEEPDANSSGSQS